LSTPFPAGTISTGVPALDTVLGRFCTLTQSTQYINVSKALLALAQRSDFAAYVKGLDPLNLVIFLPSDTKIGLQLPIDTPDKTDWSVMGVAIGISLLVLENQTGLVTVGRCGVRDVRFGDACSLSNRGRNRLSIRY
jgi:hypothetical protein